MDIQSQYRTRHAQSQALYAQAQRLVPGGLTHDARQAEPFPLYVERSSGSHKWDADENELIDYVTGHGALLLGHGHPAVVAAVQEQMARGTHYGAEHRQTLRWAELVESLFPSVELLRFTSSGTEATMMALRLARAYTGKPTVVRFLNHFHGWNDALVYGMDGELSLPPGLPTAMADSTIPLPTDLNVVEATLRSRNDIAAVILEPTGASYGTLPLPEGFLVGLRALTETYGVLLICDEVVTGFRLAPGGEQQRSGVRADLTTFAKVLCGGLPGGAVGGREPIMRLLAFGDAGWNAERKVRHNGTFNANPLSAAAGVATLERIATGEPTAYAAALGGALVSRMNQELQQRDLQGWAVYGDASIFHIIAGSSVPFAPGQLSPEVPAKELKRGGDPALLSLLRMATNNHGIDLMRGHSGFLSSAHTEADIDATVEAFAAALDDIGNQ